MGLKSDENTRTILVKLAQFLPSFYGCYYLVSIVLVGGFQEAWSSLGAFPFRIHMQLFNPAGGTSALAGWLAMPVVYALAVGLVFFIVRSTSKAWDYAVTTSLLHWVICCLGIDLLAATTKEHADGMHELQNNTVNQAFPVNWIWWVTLIVATAALSVFGELSNYYLRDLRDIQLER